MKTNIKRPRIASQGVVKTHGPRDRERARDFRVYNTGYSHGRVPADYCYGDRSASGRGECFLAMNFSRRRRYDWFFFFLFSLGRPFSTARICGFPVESLRGTDTNVHDFRFRQDFTTVRKISRCLGNPKFSNSEKYEFLNGNGGRFFGSISLRIFSKKEHLICY